jgi:glutathionyl-hydroquinone reductase
MRAMVVGLSFTLTLNEKGRYRLYAAMSCPFAHRVRLVRLLCGLKDSIQITWVSPAGFQ